MHTQRRSSLLVLSNHPTHCGKEARQALDASNTVPAMVPIRHSDKLQPLEAFLIQPFRAILEKRWRDLVIRGVSIPGRSLHQQVVDWIVEAWTFLKERPEMVKQGFEISGIEKALKKVPPSCYRQVRDNDAVTLAHHATTENEHRVTLEQSPYPQQESALIPSCSGRQASEVYLGFDAL